ncbi:recombinase family protein [Candidatus Tisiphia endosymbiont of Sialis lutaria]|uniref:recombinase family protein n=1 Tax=Candidatus Tisiphia endosymbiont of Sialis lutaria TaxID=2029164 RepID=UPI00312C7FD9
MTEKAKKAVILARVSSREQEDGYSIEAQKYRLQEYCTRKGLEILKIFEFSESSTIGNRKKFMEAIDFAKKQKELVAVVTDKVDRLQRSYKETPLLNDLIEKGKIELHFYTENCVIHKNSTSQERMMWNIFVMMAQSYVDSLKDNINRSIEQKLRLGEWVSTAPIGYLHVTSKKSERGKGQIIIDPDRAPLVKKIFETYATGNYTLLAILKKNSKVGLT